MGKKSRKKTSPRPAGICGKPRQATQDLKTTRPATYYSLVALAAASLVVPTALFDAYAAPPEGNPWGTVGWAASFLIGVGLLNLIVSRVKGYQWQYVSIPALVLGALLLALSLVLL